MEWEGREGRLGRDRRGEIEEGMIGTEHRGEKVGECGVETAV